MATRYRITAPVEGAHCTVAGVVFVDSVGETDSPGALAYFTRQGYKVEEIGDQAREPQAPKRPGKSGSKASWVAFAVANGVPQEKADALTAAQLAEQIDELIAEANKPADETQNGGQPE